MPEKRKSEKMSAKTVPDRLDFFRKSVLEWGKENLLNYPWRETRDPYKILIAEIMLHRTRAEQVVPVYKRFVDRFPDINSLRRADQAEIESILRPLGLKWRIRMLINLVRELEERYGLEIPDNYDDLVSLPGVSDYIASAVLCFAHNRPEPIIDTNTVRIVGRFFGISVNDSTRRKKSFRDFVQVLVPKSNPRLFNYSFIDLGKLVCKSRNPECSKCPLVAKCLNYEIIK